MRAVGYRQVWRYLDGDYDRAEMVRRVAAATRQVAKRQLTWLRNWNAVTVGAAAAVGTAATVGAAAAVGDAGAAVTQALQYVKRERIVA